MARTRKQLESRYKELLSETKGKNSSVLNDLIDQEFSEEEIEILFHS